MDERGTADRGDGMTLLAVEDEGLATQSPARLLITAPTQQGADTLARRIHGAGPRADSRSSSHGLANFPVSSDGTFATPFHRLRLFQAIPPDTFRSDRG